MPNLATLSFFFALLVVLLIPIHRSYVFQFVGPLKTGRFVRSINANPVTSEKSRLLVDDSDLVDWFDSATIVVSGGRGGIASNAVKFGKQRQHISGCGGNGGDGGKVYLCGSRNFNSLYSFHSKCLFRAENGFDGDMYFKNGRNGDDLTVQVPLGTVVRDNDTSEILGEICSDGEKLLVSNGGSGGIGNANIEAGQRVKSRSPSAGQKRVLHLELKLVADIGLIGLPNSGKSTLLKRITNANPKIADYAFTTIVPNLGICSSHSLDGLYRSFVVADIPGIIEGAHCGKGLGKKYLRHIERCSAIVHMVDASSCSLAQLVENIQLINKELLSYSVVLAKKPQILVVNKIEGKSNQEMEEIRSCLRQVLPHSRIELCSALCGIGINDLIVKLSNFVDKLRDQTNTD